MTRDDLIARLRKIAALAANGVGGEAANAMALLDSIAAEHGIDLNDLGSERKSMHTYRTGREQWRRNLFCQILWRLDKNIPCYNAMVPASPAKVRRRARRKGRASGVSRKAFDAVRAECTDSQFVEAVAKFEVLQRDYARQLKAFHRAFLLANDLLCDYDPASPEPTDEQKSLSADAMRLSQGIFESQLHPQIFG